MSPSPGARKGASPCFVCFAGHLEPCWSQPSWGPICHPACAWDGRSCTFLSAPGEARGQGQGFVLMPGPCCVPRLVPHAVPAAASPLVAPSGSSWLFLSFRGMQPSSGLAPLLLRSGGQVQTRSLWLHAQHLHQQRSPLWSWALSVSPNRGHASAVSPWASQDVVALGARWDVMTVEGLLIGEGGMMLLGTLVLPSSHSAGQNAALLRLQLALPWDNAVGCISPCPCSPGG